MATWQETVHEYVNLRNRAELDPLQPLALKVEDPSFIDREALRLRRIQQSHERRNMKLVRSETRMKMKEVRQNQEMILVDLHLKRNVEYTQFGTKLFEERIEQERIKLREDKGAWTIVSIIKDLGEIQPVLAIGKVPHGARFTQEQRKVDAWRVPQRSQPYMNEAVFDRYRGLNRNRRRYQRDQAVQYADTWWDVPNPEYKVFDVNCTNFVSQCLYAGGAPMNYTGKRGTGWWYRHRNDGWSYSWSVSNSLLWYLSGSQSGLSGQSVHSPKDLQLGDVIFYDWNGDGHYQHSTIVTAFDAHGMPLVHANTTNSRYRYWDYQDSYAWSERTRYRFFHISNTF